MSERLDDISLLAMLREDAPHGDLTTRRLGIAHHAARAEFHVRVDCCLACVEEAARLFELCGADVKLHAASGQRVTAGTKVLTAQGGAGPIHLAWKTAQTLLEYATGMASAAAAIVDTLRAAGHEVPLACTRKNLPGSRAMARRAVEAGGAIMHRLGLSETLLIFPEHRVFLPDNVLVECLRSVRRECPEKRLVAEATHPDEALMLAQNGVEVLQLERFSPTDVATLRRRLQAAELDPLIAVAGGVNAENALAYAEAGAALLISSAPYFAKPCDIHVKLSADLFTKSMPG